MITDLQARIIASEWHGGQRSPLYALTSTGAIVEGVEREIMEDIAYPSTDSTETARLNSLLDYVEAKGERGPQSGWSEQR